MVSGVQDLILLGHILKRPVAPFILKILHHNAAPLSRDTLLERLKKKFEAHQCELPARSRVDEDFRWLADGGLIEGQETVSLTPKGRTVAAELFSPPKAGVP